MLATLQATTESVMFDSVVEVLERVRQYASKPPVSTHVCVVTTHITREGKIHIIVDGNSSLLQRLGLLTAAIAQTQKEMGF